MTLAGWSVMITSVGGVTALCAYCIYRVWTLPPHDAEEHLEHVPHDT
ncbi:MAG: hypothetical protein QM775_13630 [Pirellulales bacterium]